MSLETLVTASLPITFFALALLELLWPGREFRGPDGKDQQVVSRTLWRLRGLAWFASTFLVSSMVPLYTDAWLARFTLIDASGLGTVGGAAAGFLVYQLGLYLWHRTMHAVPFLWRWHQTHHSAERLDVWSAWMFHPIDIAGFTVAASVGLVLVLGISGEAALLVLMAANTLTMFQHSNLRTPRWLGWLVMRPEQHQAHHQRGVHGGNFGDIALFDLLFGTFSNPETMDQPVGFEDGASSRIGALLVGADVSSPREPELRRAI